ncbi:MAG: hypothetical protein ACO1N1_05880 [Dyadobacter fermentans]
MKSVEKIILVDADVISHFLVGGYITVLPSIFPYRINILDKVYKELLQTPKRAVVINNLIERRLFDYLDFPEDNENVRKEYFRLKKLEFKGDGESACMACARFSENILASSNLRDIKRYCDMHKLKYLTTMDFLCEARRTGRMTLTECNEFLARAKEAKQKLPVTSMQEFSCREVNI